MFDDVPKVRKAAKLLVLSRNEAAAEAEREVARKAAVSIIERNGLDASEVDAAACKIAGLPRGSFLGAQQDRKAKRRLWRKGSGAVVGSLSFRARPPSSEPVCHDDIPDKPLTRARIAHVGQRVNTS